MTMPRKMWSILTYDEIEFREDAAEAWKEERVTAVGWSRIGDLRKIKTHENLCKKCDGRGPSTLWAFSKEIKKGDMIFAYAGDNIIAYVGEVIGPYKYEKGNRVGMSANDGFGYAHQRSVKWWPYPHHISRSKLPAEIADQFGIHGCIIKEIVPGSFGFDGVLDFLKNHAEALSDSGFDINEDTVKAGIRKYLRTYIAGLEKGLKITHAESGVLDRNRPDFKATDARGNVVLIECKGTADEDSVWQIKKYVSKSENKGKTRGLIVAFKITPKCKALAQKHSVELFECDLTFNRV